MWRLALPTLILALAAAFAPIASAADVAARTSGAQTFELRNGHGRAVVTRRGTVLVNVQRGRVRVIDLPGGRPPRHRCTGEERRVSETAIEYRGKDLRCSVSSLGQARPWQLVIRGHGVFASGVVRGSLTLDAVDTGRAGRFQIGDRPLKRWPRAPRTYALLAQ
jgi:hypothetical protein